MSSQLSPKGQKTRSEILEAAYGLFLERGIHATSVDDILDASSKGKSQFYHYFKSKEDLVHRLLQTHLDDIKDGNMPYDIPITNWDDFAQWLNKLVAFYRSLGEARGCILGMIGQEASPEEDLIRQDIQMIFDVKMKQPRNFFITLEAQGALIEGVNADIMTNLLLSMIQGSVLLVKVYQNEQIIDDGMGAIIIALKSFDRQYRQHSP
jgi:TetR/AcrR family transcriptional repressor of nem operon